MHIHRDDRKLRLAMTMADNAIQGPGSTRFEEEEAEVDKRPVRHVGVCQFHRLDSAGNSTDKHFPETELFDRLLRLIRKSFGFGMGAHILRAVAGRFEALTKELEQNARELASTASCSEVEGNLRKAKRLQNKSNAKLAHATFLRRAGWTTYRRPLAPKADGTRKVVWQSHSRRRVFDIFGIIYWGLQARMVEVREQATAAAEQQGHTITDRIGERCAQMKCWRSLGRALLSVQMLVFNMGRSDFRAKHISTIALTVQTTESNSIETQRHCMDVCVHMFWSLAALLDLRAIIRLLENLLLLRTAYSRPFWKKCGVGHSQDFDGAQGMETFSIAYETPATHLVGGQLARCRFTQHCVRRATSEGEDGRWRQQDGRWRQDEPLPGAQEAEICRRVERSGIVN